MHLFTARRRLLLLLPTLLAPLWVGGCRQEQKWSPGSIYALKNSDNSYSIVQLVAQGERFVVVRSFGNKLQRPPHEVDLAKLHENGRYPFPIERFVAITKVPVGSARLSDSERAEFADFIRRLEDPASAAQPR